MDNRDEFAAISRLVFELTVTSSSTNDLDVLLARIFKVLDGDADVPLTGHGAILLRNPRGRFFQIAQYGLPAFWERAFSWDQGVFTEKQIPDECRILDFLYPLNPGELNAVRAVVIPLIVEHQGLGYGVFFVSAEFQPDSRQKQFFSDLGRALSGFVHRSVTHETLKMRELELEEARADALRSLGVASEYRDNETGWHIMRMTNMAQAVAKAMNLSEDQRELLYITAPMHDVGKIGIADAVLLKPGKLTDEEFALMKSHTHIGMEILTGNDPMIAAARDIAGNHHERWDGQGYPRGLKGEEIPLLARICAVADVFDALTSHRPYKEAWSVEAASEFIIKGSGTQFDPAVVEAFKAAMPEIMRIRELYRDDIIDPKEVAKLPPLSPRQDAWVQWEDDLSVGIATIDEHHRYLIDLINDLYDVIRFKKGAREVGRLIKALEAYAKVHFRTEELMMKHYHYTGIDRQEKQHHAFEAKVTEFYEEMHGNPLVAQFDVLSYIRDWLIHHIQQEDAGLSVLTR